jgi:hypothetical protein
MNANRPSTRSLLLSGLAAALSTLVFIACERASATGQGNSHSNTEAEERAFALAEKGKQVFRFDSLGSEAFWGDALRIHETIAGAALGGVGPGVSPATALAVGLKVDEEALPGQLKSDLLHGRVDLGDPANTVALLKLDAVVGVRGVFEQGSLRSIGISCALCHSTVDDSLLPGIGRRRDGWPNRDLDVGQVISLAQDLSPFTNLLGVPEKTVREVLASWGPGRFDAHLILDGKAFRPDGKSASVLIPAALGLGGVNLSTYTGWGSVPHWNGFVGNLEMHGKGRFFDPRLDDPVKFPIAAFAGFSNVTSTDDRITPILEPLQVYQLAIPIPQAPQGSFDPDAAQRGKELFADKADCARCHVPPLFTEPGFNAHTADEIGIDEFQALRSPTERYRTTPLRGLFTRTKGGFYHDGRFADLAAVVEHYDQTFGLLLGAAEKSDLIEYLKSL